MTKSDNRSSSFESIELRLYLFLSFVLFLVLGYRATLGVDFTDESYHLANAYKFFLGAIPFKDELFSAQGFALLTKPIVSTLINLTGSTAGIVLKMRWAFLCFQFLISLFLFSVLKRTFSTASALAASLSYFCFVPMNLFSLFYVTLGVGFLALGMGCFYLASQSQKPSTAFFLGSFALALSFIAHPVMAIPISVIAALISWPLDKNGFKRLLLFSTSFLFLVAVFFVIYGFSPLDWLRAVQGSRHYNAEIGNVWGFPRLLLALKTLVMWGPWLSFILIIFGFLVFATYRNQAVGKYQFIALVLLPLFIFFNSRMSAGGIGPAGYLLSLGWLSFILVWSTVPLPEAKRFLLWFLLPAAAATLAMSFTSNSGVSSTSTGFLPILPVALLLLSSAIQKSFPKSSFFKPYLGSIVILFFLLIFVRGTFQSAFKEPRFSELKHPISAGPFQGLKTSQFRKDFIEKLHTHLNQLKDNKKSILFTCFFPAGYLLTDLKPGYFFVWGAPGNGNNLFDSELLVRVFDKTYPLLGISSQSCQPLQDEVSGKKGQLVKEEFYEIGLF